MADVEHTLDELIEYFTPNNCGMEEEHFCQFVACRLGERPVSALVGINESTALHLAELGIHKAWQLLGSVLNSKKEETVEMLVGLGISSSHAKRIAYGLLLNFQRSCGV